MLNLEIVYPERIAAQVIKAIELCDYALFELTIRHLLNSRPISKYIWKSVCGTLKEKGMFDRLLETGWILDIKF